MKEITLFVVALSVCAAQGCTINNYHTSTKNAGIAAEGKPGPLGSPGRAGAAATAQAQRKLEIQQQEAASQGKPSQGLLGPEGLTARGGRAGKMPAEHMASKQNRQPDPFGAAFFEKAILNVLQWCIVARCGSKN